MNFSLSTVLLLNLIQWIQCKEQLKPMSLYTLCMSRYVMALRENSKLNDIVKSIKEYENSALTDDDVRLPGPNIDGVIKNIKLDIPFSLVEVSGSPNHSSENYSHYKGDRNKLAKNLKYLFKIIISMKGMPLFKTASKLKLFGIHIYYDQIYVYSMSMPMWDVFVFKLEFKFDIPINPALFSSTLPTFVSKLFKLGEILVHFNNERAA